jgi:hypothetical protein
MIILSVVLYGHGSSSEGRTSTVGFQNMVRIILEPKGEEVTGR